MNLIRYREPVSFFNEVDRFFNQAFAALDRPVGPNGGRLAGYAPVDLYEDDNNAYARLELPGFKRDEVRVEIEDNTVTVEAGQGDDARRRTLRRSFTLPGAVDASRVEARLEDGILTLTMPKSEAAKPRRIEVR